MDDGLFAIHDRCSRVLLTRVPVLVCAEEETKLEREQQAQKQAGSKKGAGGKQKK